MLSDEEFDKLLKEREQLPRAEHERWDNAGIRPPQQMSDGLPESCLEQQFPHVAQKLTVVWPSEACALYISGLIVNRRDTRQGFPNEVVEDLLMLHEINDMLVAIGKRGQRNTAAPPFASPSPRRQP